MSIIASQNRAIARFRPIAHDSRGQLGLNIKNEETFRLVEELARLAGGWFTAAGTRETRVEAVPAYGAHRNESNRERVRVPHRLGSPVGPGRGRGILGVGAELGTFRCMNRKRRARTAHCGSA